MMPYMLLMAVGPLDLEAGKLLRSPSFLEHLFQSPSHMPSPNLACFPGPTDLSLSLESFH